MTKHLSKTLLHTHVACDDLMLAHSDAIKQGDQFAEIVLSDLLESARKLEQRIARALDAAQARAAIATAIGGKGGK